jgi:folate-binding protein YgfZ
MQAMCTADVTAIAEGSFARAAILTAKGRIQSIMDIVNRGTDLLLLCEPVLVEKTLTLLAKHAIMDEVEFTRIDQPSHRHWAAPDTIWAAPPILSAPPPDQIADPAAVEIRRIEAGMLRYGVDVSEEDFPFESLLASCIDYHKGCYLGQEPVFRVHQRGTAKRMMRGLAVEGDQAVAVGTQVSHPARDLAGTVTSATVSPDFGSIALAYLHQLAWTPGDQVTIDGRPAEIVELPFRA